MKRLRLALLLIGLSAVGCTPFGRQVQPEPVAKKNSDVPVTLEKLLPAEHVNAKNAHSQAQILEQTLSKESGFAERTESARRE